MVSLASYFVNPSHHSNQLWINLTFLMMMAIVYLKKIMLWLTPCHMRTIFYTEPFIFGSLVHTKESDDSRLP